jgi:ATP-dependent Clp protease ATP-binding subunit ClpA
MRQYKVIIGSKSFFDKRSELIISAAKTVCLTLGQVFPTTRYFLELVHISDECVKRGVAFKDENKAELMLVKNDDYNGLTESAHDRLGSLIEELTTDNAIIIIHNPTMRLSSFLDRLFERKEIRYRVNIEKYDILRHPYTFRRNIKKIGLEIFGQSNAISEVSKSLWYLTSAQRKKPYVIMLYGDSSLGKSELVRKIAQFFFNGKLVEKHLSMYKNNNYADDMFGQLPNRKSLGYDLLERASNLLFLDELDKCPEHFYSAFYTLFDNTVFQDTTYRVDISGLLIIATSNYKSMNEMRLALGLPIFYRIDKFIHFEPLSKDAIYKIAMNEINAHLKECENRISGDDIYAAVAPSIKTSGENARTIKQKVQEILENILFQEVYPDN